VPTDKFSQNERGVIAPYTRAVTITPSDSTDLAETPRALQIHAGTGSTPVKVTMAGDSAAVTMNLQTGFIFPLRVSRVWATGTSATSVIALY
jgi:hypothetical protein